MGKKVQNVSIYVLTAYYILLTTLPFSLFLPQKSILWYTDSMPQNPYVMNGLKYATYTLGVLVVVISIAALMNGVDTGSLTGRLISPQERGETPTMKFDQERARTGFSAPPDTHVIFTVPNGSPVTRTTFFGGVDFDEARYWGYCYSGREARNKENGLTGSQLYDGKFFYSIGERKAQTARPAVSDSDLVGILDATKQAAPAEPKSMAEIFTGGTTCYLMTSVTLPVGIDQDADLLNSERERELGLSDMNPDADGDGINDGNEVFVTKTDPRLADTDNDGLSDTCEDTNMDGQVDPDETSAVLADSDRDGLCDGNGYASACPEPKQIVCETREDLQRDCSPQPSSPVHGEDMNQNCKVDNDETDPRNANTFGPPDWDYKWNKFQLGSPGTPAPEFPIPGLPVNN